MVRLDATRMTTAKLTISASQAQIAAGKVMINTPLVNFSDVVRAEPVTAKSVILGAGKISGRQPQCQAKAGLCEPVTFDSSQRTNFRLSYAVEA